MSVVVRAMAVAIALSLGTAVHAQENGQTRTTTLTYPWDSWRAPAQVAPVGQAQRFGGVCQACDLSNRRLPGVRIANGDFSRASFVRAFLVRMDGAGSTFVEADFSLANMTSTQLKDAKADRARFSGAMMNDFEASRAALNGADFSNADLRGAVFAQSGLEGAKFAGAKAPEANFLRANLTDASFAFAYLDGADFTQADLTRADFSHATLSGANLSSAQNLSKHKLEGACGDGETKLPVGLPKLPPCDRESLVD
jgi:uncharacterized protein YjbI with pentapeptide repeats